MKRDREPKKTETLEIRLAAETKAALQLKARAHGKSVSDVLRTLIAHYLGAADPLASERRHTIMRFSSIAAAAAATIGAALLLTPHADARDLTLDVSAHIETASTRATSARTLETTLDLDFNTPVLLCLPAGAAQAATIRAVGACPTDGYAILVSARSAGADSVLIGARVLGQGETAQTFAEMNPSMQVALGAQAAIQTSAAGGAETLRLSFSPRRP